MGKTTLFPKCCVKLSKERLLTTLPVLCANPAAPSKIPREAWRSREIGVELLPKRRIKALERLAAFSGMAQRVARVGITSKGRRQPAARRGTVSKASRRPHRGVEPFPRYRDDQRKGFKPLPRGISGRRRPKKYFQGAATAGGGRKTGSTAPHPPTAVAKRLPSGCAARLFY